jgi:hypothetical protein
MNKIGINQVVEVALLQRSCLETTAVKIDEAAKYFDIMFNLGR